MTSHLLTLSELVTSHLLTLSELVTSHLLTLSELVTSHLLTLTYTTAFDVAPLNRHYRTQGAEPCYRCRELEGFSKRGVPSSYHLGEEGEHNGNTLWKGIVVYNLV